MNDMTVNDSEICEMKRRSLINTGDFSPEHMVYKIKNLLFAAISNTTLC